MISHLHLEILPQPNDVTCGPTCLQAIYRYFGDDISLAQTIAEVPMLEEGGTLAALLANHALRRGYSANLYTYKLQLFDPTWFDGQHDLAERLRAQMAVKTDAKLHAASRAYLDYLRLGGKVLYKDLTGELIRGYLRRNIPILVGLSATYLYGTPREYGPDCLDDDLRGEPLGHFVVLCGDNRAAKTVRIADPMRNNPVAGESFYEVPMTRLICAIMLGVLTYDANLLILQPGPARERS